ncbi:hypothetical protein ACIA5H_37565 [Nocardia sp. NPDC051900]|uniref:hypothetical protein n=1 Tax=Nocardia sp. NPDC051900 TaxID=3364326 RepID=UPI00378AF694
MGQVLLAQQQVVEPVSGTLVQYGAVGVFALVELAVVWVLWRRLERINDAERQRADRLEKQLLDFYELVGSKLSGELVRATEVMREVAESYRQRGDR